MDPALQSGNARGAGGGARRGPAHSYSCGTLDACWAAPGRAPSPRRSPAPSSAGTTPSCSRSSRPSSASCLGAADGPAAALRTATPCPSTSSTRAAGSALLTKSCAAGARRVTRRARRTEPRPGAPLSAPAVLPPATQSASRHAAEQGHEAGRGLRAHRVAAGGDRALEHVAAEGLRDELGDYAGRLLHSPHRVLADRPAAPAVVGGLRGCCPQAAPGEVDPLCKAAKRGGALVCPKQPEHATACPTKLKATRGFSHS